MKNKYWNLNIDVDRNKRFLVVAGNRGSGRTHFLNQIKSKEEQNERKSKHSKE